MHGRAVGIGHAQPGRTLPGGILLPRGFFVVILYGRLRLGAATLRRPAATLRRPAAAPGRAAAARIDLAIDFRNPRPSRYSKHR